MSALVAWVKVTRKRKLQVVEVDVDAQPELAGRLDVTTVPTLVLVEGAEVVGRLEGRATGPEIERFLEPHLAEDA